MQKLFWLITLYIMPILNNSAYNSKILYNTIKLCIFHIIINYNFNFILLKTIKVNKIFYFVLINNSFF